MISLTAEQLWDSKKPYVHAAPPYLQGLKSTYKDGVSVGYQWQPQGSFHKPRLQPAHVIICEKRKDIRQEPAREVVREGHGTQNASLRNCVVDDLR